MVLETSKGDVVSIYTVEASLGGVHGFLTVEKIGFEIRSIGCVVTLAT